ncbi:MAG: hypothetical protein ACTSW1_10540 [Candidatus Hodarchaeales archaeon]
MIDSELVKKYTVKDDGTLNPVAVSSISDLADDNVFIIVDENARKIYIWKGEKAPVRRKFISAKAAQQMRQEKYGMVYRIDSLDPGLEGADFLSLFGVTREQMDASRESQESRVQPSQAPTPSAAPRVAPRSAPTTTAPRAAPTTSSTPKTETSTTSPRPAPITPKPSSSQRPTPTPSSQTSYAPTRPPVQHQRVVRETEVVVTGTVKTKPIVSIDEVTQKLKELEIPPTMEREIVIIGNLVFSVIREHLTLFSKDVVKLEPMDDLPSGIFPAADYQVRLFIDEGRVMFIELLRQKTRSERDEFIDDMRKSLQDLSKLGI